MFDKYKVVDVLGDLCYGVEVSQAEREFALAALSGAVRTEDGGAYLYYVNVEVLLLDNTDTDEAIWNLPADGILRSSYGDTLIDLSDYKDTFQQRCFPLRLMGDSANFAHVEEMWLSDLEARPMWEVLVARVIEPLRKWLDCQSAP